VESEYQCIDDSMKSIFSFILVFVFSLFLAGESAAQACGNIHAKFFVLDGNGRFVSTAKLEVVRPETGDSVLYRNEIRISADEPAFKLTHGLCGSHYNVRLVIADKAHDKFEATIDLPLNSALAEHVFTIRLTGRGSEDSSSIEIWGRLFAEAKDGNGNPIAGVQVVMTTADGNTVTKATSKYGTANLSARPGVYSLEATNPNGDKIRLDNVTVSSGPKLQEISFTFKQ
jgi:hypothetical protein